MRIKNDHRSEQVAIHKKIHINFQSLPSTEKLRCVTSKLGQFIGLKSIQTIPLNSISSRFILDLNLPSQMHGMVNELIKKTDMLTRNKINFEIGEYVNMEELGLAHIYIVLVVLIKYDALDYESKIEPNTFILSEWVKEMQNVLTDYKKNLYGCEYDQVNSVDDLKTMKYDIVKHRHNNNTKPYISQYRRELIKTALKAPLIHCESKKKRIIYAREEFTFVQHTYTCQAKFFSDFLEHLY